MTTKTKMIVELAINCPVCNQAHVDKGEFYGRPHRTHRCEYCHFEWEVTVRGGSNVGSGDIIYPSTPITNAK